MIVHAIHDASLRADSKLIDQQHQLRARVFAERLGWNVNVLNGREIDEFDSLSPTYILAVTGTGAVVGTARLLPAIGPTMLERTFPQLLAAGQLEAHHGMIESSRFCVDTSFGEGRGKEVLHEATLAMFAGIIEWSIANGCKEIVTATDLRFERILRRAGWPMRRLGEPRRIGNTTAVAGSLSADIASFHQVCPEGYRSTIARGSQRAA